MMPVRPTMIHGAAAMSDASVAGNAAVGINDAAQNLLATQTAKNQGAPSAAAVPKNSGAWAHGFFL